MEKKCFVAIKTAGSVTWKTMSRNFAQAISAANESEHASIRLEYQFCIIRKKSHKNAKFFGVKIRFKHVYINFSLCS